MTSGTDKRLRNLSMTSRSQMCRRSSSSLIAPWTTAAWKNREAGAQSLSSKLLLIGWERIGQNRVQGFAKLMSEGVKITMDAFVGLHSLEIARDTLRMILMDERTTVGPQSNSFQWIWGRYGNGFQAIISYQIQT